jgi:hypothetical protein
MGSPPTVTKKVVGIFVHVFTLRHFTVFKDFSILPYCFNPSLIGTLTILMLLSKHFEVLVLNPLLQNSKFQ